MTTPSVEKRQFKFSFSIGRRYQMTPRRFGGRFVAQNATSCAMAAACVFLCGAQAGFVSGQNLSVDGGTYPGVF